MTDLKFNESGRFKVMQLTDIHFENHGETDEKSLRLIRQLIQQEVPDLIVVSGDTVYGPNNLNNLRPALARICESGIAWTWAFGNHDAEDGHSKEELFRHLNKLPGCLAYDAAPGVSGVANHDIQIKNDRGELRWLISLLDSGDYMNLPSNPPERRETIGGYDMVKNDQITWFMDRITGHETNTEDFAALLFLHIPLPEYNEVWNTKTCYGEKREQVCCAPLNSGLFAAMQKVGHVRGVFCGHDHINDYYGDLYGIKLGYGRATGYNTYGQEGFLRGARLFELNETDTYNFKTWIRLEDGSVWDGLERVHEPEHPLSK